MAGGPHAAPVRGIAIVPARGQPGMTRPAVLVFAGLDPSGGAGISADIEAIAANGAHALPVVTALTVQDNNRVHGVHPVDGGLIAQQAAVLCAAFDIRAVKTGIPGNRANAEAVRAVVMELRRSHPGLPVVVDPVLASGAGDRLGIDDAAAALAPLLEVATVALPNTREAAVLPLQRVPHLLVTGGHETGARVINRYRHGGIAREWHWDRLPGEFHGSGCTLASAVAAWLARGAGIEHALGLAQQYTQRALAAAYPIAAGQLIPLRHHESEMETT